MQPGFERYQRQIILKEFGKAGQQKLLDAKVLVVGAGGLGCPALLYLAASGVGTIGIADDDVVSLSNLHRQVLFTVNDIGKSKVLTAAKRLKQLNPQINIVAHQVKLTNTNALEIIEQYDVIIDGTDNFPSKYLLNDACVLIDKPLVYGAVSKFEGQVAMFNVADENGMKCNYRDLFAAPPTEKILNCEEEGVLGILPGIIGLMQATETIKLISNIGSVLINQILFYNALNLQSYTIQLSKNNNYTLPQNEDALKQMNYDFYCEVNSNVHIIDAATFKIMLKENHSLFIDVREKDEMPEVRFPHKKIPFSKFENEVNNIQADKIVLFCASGKRSLKAAQMLADINTKNKNIYSLKNGIGECKIKSE